MPGAGFPNAMEEAGSLPLDLTQMVIKSPASTFFMRVDSDLHTQMGIYSGDIVIIDKSLQMRPGDLVVIYQDGEFGMRRIPRELESTAVHEEAILWGVVTYTLHRQRGRI